VGYRSHLAWVIARAVDKRFADVRPIPVRSMPFADVPQDWVHCRFGSLEFALPPELAKNPEAPMTDAPLLGFYDKSRSIAVHLPTASQQSAEFFKTDLKSPPQGQGLSLVRLSLACREANPEDFRWTMSPNEVHWLAWRITIGHVIRLQSVERAETLFRDDLEAVAYFLGKRAVLDWQAKDRDIGGYIHFMHRASDGPIDPNWVRAVCHSLKFTGKSFPDRLRKDQLLAEFQILAE
jgi:hypothetical protein